MTTRHADTFAPESTRAVLDEACHEAHLDAQAAALVRIGENALFHLQREGLMARVARSADAAHKEVDIARWLQSHDFPAVRLADRIPQPVLAQGVNVTFWEFIEEDSNELPNSSDLGEMLRRLHALPAPKFSLPQFNPMPKVDARLANIRTRLPDDDCQFLALRKSELAEEFETLDFPLPLGHIHGDAHRHNLMRNRNDGVVRLIDLEDFCYGPREWDLSIEAIGYQAFGWISEAAYRSYVQACGFDPLQWSGFAVIRSIRELNMTTWLAQRLGQSTALDNEVRKRISDLRDDDAPRQWGAF